MGARVLPDETPEPPAVLSGRIVDAAGVSIPRGAVHVYEEGLRRGTGARFLDNTWAADEGRFRMEISPGPCLLIPIGPAEGVIWQPILGPVPEKAVLRLGLPPVDAEEEAPAGARSRIMGTETPVPDAPFRGRVLDASGVPVEGAEVRWAPAGDEGKKWELDLLAHEVGRTDAEGRFSARGFPPGPAVLLADLEHAVRYLFGDPARASARVTLVEDRETSGIEIRLPFALAEVATLECRVVDDHGAPRDGVGVDTTRTIHTLRPAVSGETDREGRIAFRVLPGRVEVHARETESHEAVREQVEVSPGGTHRVELRTPAKSGPRTLSLRVRVRDETGAPVAGAEVLLSHQEGGLGKGRTGADGTCLFRDLPDASRRDEVHASAFAEGFCISSGRATVVRWPKRGPAEAEVRLQHSVEIAIRIVDDATGGFVPGCTFEIRDAVHRGSRQYSDWDHEGGGMNFIHPGTVTLRAHAPGYAVAKRRVKVVRTGERPVFELRLKRIR